VHMGGASSHHSECGADRAIVVMGEPAEDAAGHGTAGVGAGGRELLVGASDSRRVGWSAHPGWVGSCLGGWIG
jgi:hypothetical protein